MRLRLPGRLWKDGRFWLIEVPALDAMTQGRTRKEAFAMIKDLVETMVDTREFRVKVIAGHGDRFEVAGDAEYMLALFLRRQREHRGLSLSALAELLGHQSKTAVARYEQGVTMPTTSKLFSLLQRLAPDFDLLLDLRPCRPARSS